jgi:hypothetical protein
MGENLEFYKDATVYWQTQKCKFNGEAARILCRGNNSK